jgi:hypothetical protein
MYYNYIPSKFDYAAAIARGYTTPQIATMAAEHERREKILAARDPRKNAQSAARIAKNDAEMEAENQRRQKEAFVSSQTYNEFPRKKTFEHKQKPKKINRCGPKASSKPNPRRLKTAHKTSSARSPKKMNTKQKKNTK